MVSWSLTKKLGETLGNCSHCCQHWHVINFGPILISTNMCKLAITHWTPENVPNASFIILFACKYCTCANAHLQLTLCKKGLTHQMDIFFNGHHLEGKDSTVESWFKKDLNLQIYQHTTFLGLPFFQYTNHSLIKYDLI